MKMSKRERMLVVVLVLTAIAVCGFMFVIKPVMDARASYQIQIQEKEAEKKTLEEQVLRFNAVKAELESSTAIVEDNSKLFYPSMHNWEVERIVTSVLKKYPIDIQSIELSDPVSFELPAVNSTDENGNEIEGKTTPTSLQVTSIAVAFRSEFDAIKDYVDAVSKINRKTTLTGWNYQVKLQADEAGIPTKFVYEGTFLINLYSAPAEEQAEAVEESNVA